MTPASTLPARYLPKVPQTMEELGIPQSMVTDLMLRRLMIEGNSTLAGLSKALRLSVAIVDLTFRHLRQQQLIEVKGMLGNDYSFTLSAAGKALAAERFQLTQYAGAAPVSLNQYHEATRAQSAHLQIDRRSLRQALGDMVVTDRLLDQLGPALISQNSIF